MANTLNHVAPKYVAPADWNRASVSVGASLPLIRRTGTYVTSQSILDSIVSAALATGTALVYLDVAPMGFTSTRVRNPNVYYPTPALLAEYLSAAKRAAEASAPNLRGAPIYVYGNSYGVTVATGWYTVGKHYSQLASAEVLAGPVTSYAVGGRRILDVCTTLVNGSAIVGTSGVLADGKMPSDDSRKGLMILESAVNDTAHYPAMNVGVAQPASITSANTRYLDTMKTMYRTAIALMSGGTRVEQSAAAFSGTWASQAFVANYASGGTVAYTSTVGAAATYTVTPPQSGPLRGKVFHMGYRLDPAVAVSAAYNVAIDGGAPTLVTTTGWEQYTGHTGGVANTAWDMVAIDLPVDGAAHTVAISHAGSAGQFLYSDCIVVPSTDPNPVAVMGAELPPNVGVFTQANVNAYRSNMKRMEDALKAVTAEFPNAFYVPSTMTSGGLYSGDGLHPNDRGNAQRANDLVAAIRTHLTAKYRNRALATETYPIL